MKRVPVYEHDKDAKLDYGWDWSVWLAAGETITAQTVTSDQSSTVVTNVNLTNSIVTAWVQASTSCNVSCHITTSLGRTDDRSIFLLVKDR